MGMRTDFEIAEFRRKAGITRETSKEEATKLLHAAGVKPATGKRAELLRQILDAAEHAIPAVERELSGECDGDGGWHGSDSPVDTLTSTLAEACKELEDWEDKVWEAQRILREHEHGASKGLEW